MRILLAELAPEPGDIDANLERIGKILATTPSDLAVFPELYLSGYRLGDRFHQIALEPADRTERRLKALAREHATGIVVGAPVRPAVRKGEVQNAAVLVTPDGRVHVQAKRFLPTFGPFEEGGLFTPTRESRPNPVGTTSVGLEVCYDAFFPEVSRDLALAGADLLVIISAAPITSRGLFGRILPARAIENAFPLVYVNRVGVEDGLVFGGGSVALDARGEPVEGDSISLDSAERGERVVLVQIDPASGARWRPFRPVLRDVSHSDSSHAREERWAGGTPAPPPTSSPGTDHL